MKVGLLILSALIVGIIVGFFIQLPQIDFNSFIGGVRVHDMNFTKVSDTDLKITFKTSKPVSVELNYGTTELYGVIAKKDEVTDTHEILLSGLLPNKDHNFKLNLRTPEGKVISSSNYFVKAL